MISRWLSRLLAKIDGRELRREDWLRRGWPRGALLPAVLFPTIIAGPIRYVTGVSLALGFVFGTLLTILAAAPLARALRHSGLSRRTELALTVAVAAVAVFAAALPYNRHFAGMANYIGADGYMAIDGAYHGWNYFDFALRRSTVYGGFVSLYSFWDAFHRLGSRHLLVAIDASFLYGRFAVAVAPCLVSFSVLYKFRDDRRAYWAGAGVCVVGCLLVQYWLILPLETFHLMGGFWSHLFGLVPTMALWMADALVRQRLVRVAALFAAGALYRYTYGLNLADVLAAVGALLVLEALGRALPAWVRVLSLVGAMVAFLAARYCFLLTAPLFREWGWIVVHDVPAAGDGQRIALAAFAVTIGFWPARATAAGSGIARALRFPLLFGLTNLLFIFLIRRLPTGTYYYFVKYDLHAIVLVASAAVVVACFWVAVCVSRFRLATASGLVVALALLTLGLTQVRRALAPYQDGFHEQVSDGSYQRSQPWVIPAAVARMQRTLDQEKKSFGGYLSKHLPLYLFTNALFDRSLPDWQSSRTLRATPGTCVFWDGGRYPSWDSLDNKECHSYLQQPWGRYEVCGACY